MPLITTVCYARSVRKSKIKILGDFTTEVLLKATLFSLMLPGLIALDYVAQLLA